ncbi:MAG TPA: hypothetical protein VI796_00125, partial [Candidatus Thermoplasmatota archaeon]|nr:hypothetical protein [Candidatus Thermoplasmatota archaeon]
MAVTPQGRARIQAVLAATLAASFILGFAPTGRAHSEDVPPQTGGHGDDVDESGFWNVVTGFATKTGFRMVFAWDSDEPIQPLVEWGYDPDQMDKVARPVGDVVDTAGIVFLDNYDLPRGNKTEVFFRFVDESGGAFATSPPDSSPIHSFVQGNAMQSDTHDDVYEVNVVVALDSEALPSEVPADLGLADLVQGIDIFAERVWDYTDGNLRIASVLIMDRIHSYPTGPLDAAGGAAGIVQAGGEPITCGLPSATAEGMQVDHTFPDFIIETSPPFDSHTSKNDASGPLIKSSCYGFYVGRDGWLYANPWTPADLGAVFAHEFGHYALNLDDLYPTGLPGDSGATCWEGTSGTPGDGSNWDVSVMHNGFRWDGQRWVGSELDSVQTPCSNIGTATYSWNLFTKWYPEVPLMRNGNGRPNHFDSDYQVMQGNPDGGALDVYVLDREPGLSKLQHVLAPPVLPPPPEPHPTLIIERPTEGQAFAVDRVDISGFVDRGYPDLPLSVDAHGPYAAKVGEEVILIGSAANGIGPYEYLWTTSGPATFADPTVGITKAVFTGEGTFQLQLQAWDRGDNDPFKPSSTATDVATITVVPAEPEPGPQGCPPLGGQVVRRASDGQPAIDSGSDTLVVPTYGSRPAAELLCLGADFHTEDLLSVPVLPLGTKPVHTFTFQLQVLDKDSVHTQPRNGVPTGSISGNVYEPYLITFTPNFGDDLRKGVPQWIFVKWDRTPDVTGRPVDRLTACWLVLPPGPQVAGAPTVQTYDYDQWDCDPSRTAAASWTAETLQVSFDMDREIGQAGDGDKFENVYARAHFRKLDVQTSGSLTSLGPQWGGYVLDVVPDSKDGFVRFAGPGSLQTPSLAPPPTGFPLGPNPEKVTVEGEFGSRGDPEVVDPPGDSPYAALDIIGVWVQDDLVDLPIPSDTFTLVMRVADLDTAVGASTTGAVPVVGQGFLIGPQLQWTFSFCINSSKQCYSIDAYNDAVKGERAVTGAAGFCYSPSPEPAVLTKFLLDADEIHVRVRADWLDVRSVSGTLATCSISEGGAYAKCGTRLYNFRGVTDMVLWFGIIGIPIRANAPETRAVFDGTAVGKDYTFCRPDFEVDAGSALQATRGQPTAMGGTVTGGIPAYTCTWTAPGATFTNDPGDPTGCFLVSATFAICGEIPVTLTGQDSYAPPNVDADTTSVQVTGASCDEAESLEYVEILATPIQPSGAAPVAPLSLAKIPVQTSPGDPREAWSYLWSGLTPEYDGFWNVTAKWFDRALGDEPLAADTVNITIG